MKKDFKFYCKICGKELIDDVDEHGFICEECYEKNCNEEMAFEVGRYINYYEGTEKININDFLLFAFTDDEIEHILLNELRNTDKVLVDRIINNYLENKDFEIADIIKTPENEKKW